MCTAARIGMKQNKVKIAVTGGIGSGKSTVCKLIKALNYPVYSCDEAYKEVLADGRTVAEILKTFGGAVSDGNGGINRGKLSALVFGDEGKLAKLNSITHPKIFEKMFEASQKDCGLVFYEVPLLFEGGYVGLFDEVIVVLRDRQKRIEAVALRDNLKEEEVIARINKQLNYDISDFAQYYVIHNNANIDNMSDVINDILLKITEKYKTE